MTREFDNRDYKKILTFFICFRVILIMNVNSQTSNVVSQDVWKCSNDEIKTITKKIVPTKKIIVNIAKKHLKLH